MKVQQLLELVESAVVEAEGITGDSDVDFLTGKDHTDVSSLSMLIPVSLNSAQTKDGKKSLVFVLKSRDDLTTEEMLQVIIGKGEGAALVEMMQKMKERKQPSQD